MLLQQPHCNVVYVPTRLSLWHGIGWVLSKTRRVHAKDVALVAFAVITVAVRSNCIKFVCKQIEEYKKLIKDASVHELRKYDVILCTCAVSASPRLIAGANVSQIIVDEGGMCMEPECLIPLVSFKDAQQVVLIGDHKQLQPIVFNTVAKNLGLEKSLFERYKDRALMLNEQYRMVCVARFLLKCWPIIPGLW